jgi:hypothetical protein
VLRSSRHSFHSFSSLIWIRDQHGIYPVFILYIAQIYSLTMVLSRSRLVKLSQLPQYPMSHASARYVANGLLDHLLSNLSTSCAVERYLARAQSHSFLTRFSKRSLYFMYGPINHPPMISRVFVVCGIIRHPRRLYSGASYTSEPDKISSTRQTEYAVRI